MKTRKQAAYEIYVLQSMMQARPYSLNTIYRRIFKSGDAWRFIGNAYDYTA